MSSSTTCHHEKLAFFESLLLNVENRCPRRVSKGRYFWSADTTLNGPSEQEGRPCLPDSRHQTSRLLSVADYSPSRYWVYQCRSRNVLFSITVQWLLVMSVIIWRSLRWLRQEIEERKLENYPPKEMLGDSDTDSRLYRLDASQPLKCWSYGSIYIYINRISYFFYKTNLGRDDNLMTNG